MNSHDKLRILQFVGWEIQTDPTERKFGFIRRDVNDRWQHEIDAPMTFDILIKAIRKIESVTGFTLVMSAGYSYWVEGDGTQLYGDFNGYDRIDGVFDAVITFLKESKIDK